MENNTNRQMDITGDVIHHLGVEFKYTLREINTFVGDKIYAIVGELIKKEELREDTKQSLLFK